VVVELVAGLCVVFAAFAKDVGADVQGGALLFCTENNNQNNFDANGNLLNLNNIGNLEWHYNNTLNKLIKADKPNTTQYYVYD
jgi:hypothetical protein